MHNEPWRSRFARAGLVGVAVVVAFASNAHAVDGRASVVERAASLEMRLESGELSVFAYQAPLRRVVDRLAELSGAEVTGLGQVGSAFVTIRFTNLPLAEAVARIVRPHSFALFLRSTPQGEQLERLAILAYREEDVGEPSRARRADAEVAGVDDRVYARIAALDLRLQASDDRAAHDLLAQTLTGDPDARVRAAALERLAETGSMPADVARDVARYDPDAGLRKEALLVLARRMSDDQDASATLSWISGNDADPGVRGLAARLLAPPADVDPLRGVE